MGVDGAASGRALCLGSSMGRLTLRMCHFLELKIPTWVPQGHSALRCWILPYPLPCHLTSASCPVDHDSRDQGLCHR